MEFPIIIGVVILIAVVVLFIVLKKRRKSKTDWPMDPRLRKMAEWAYACVLEVTGVPVGELPVPNVKGTREKWGDNNAIGSYYMSTRSILVLLGFDATRLPHVMLHEMAHDIFARLHGLSTKTKREDFANTVNRKCRAIDKFWPAPLVDWNAK